MASQHCPECRSSDVELRETRTDDRPVEIVVYRHYRCLAIACGSWFHTAEKLISIRPEAKWLDPFRPEKQPRRRADSLPVGTPG